MILTFRSLSFPGLNSPRNIKETKSFRSRQNLDFNVRDIEAWRKVVYYFQRSTELNFFSSISPPILCGICIPPSLNFRKISKFLFDPSIKYLEASQTNEFLRMNLKIRFYRRVMRTSWYSSGWNRQSLKISDFSVSINEIFFSLRYIGDL